MEIDITEFFSNACHRCYSASISEIGNDAGPITWQNAIDASESDWLMLTTDEARDAFRAHVRGFGAWTDEEIAAWSDVELNALFIQFVAGDIRESRLDRGMSWADYEENAKSGSVSGRLFKGDSRVYYSLCD